jgi:hypothetical protein
MAIGRKPLESFAMLNNLVASNTKATELKISPWATMPTTWNIFENLEDGLFGMKHPEKCS